MQVSWITCMATPKPSWLQEGIYAFEAVTSDDAISASSASDTIVDTLTCAFYRLALHLDEQSKLRIKIASLDMVDRKALAADTALQAFFNETLRLHPVVLTGSLRVTPPEGQVIAGKYTPSGVTLCVPRYSLARNETNFERPVDFVPDRWAEQGDMVKDGRVHLPFGQGRYLCLGQRIAYIEMHAILVRLLKKYQMTFAPGEDGRSLEAQTRDQFASLPGEVMLRFMRR